MELLVLSSQNSDIVGEIIVWTLNLVTKQLIKVHASEIDMESICVGDCIELSIKGRCKRQEVWGDKCIKLGSCEDDLLREILDKKAATPFSVIEPSYVGNICKIEEFISVDKNEAVVSLYGFPKERKYIQIFDLKWNLYAKYNQEINLDFTKLLNTDESKYLIVDFPENKLKGKIQVAALVVI